MACELKGEIIHIRKIFDEANCKYYWEIVTEVDDTPLLHLGAVELRQK